MKAIIDEETYQQLLQIHKSNWINGGHYTVFPCRCEPSCDKKYGITTEMLDEHNAKLKKDWEAFMATNPQQNRHLMSLSGIQGPQNKQ